MSFKKLILFSESRYNTISMEYSREHKHEAKLELFASVELMESLLLWYKEFNMNVT